MSKKFKYEYEYTSPYGENWRVDKKWFGFLWITHSRPYHIDTQDYESIKVYVEKLEIELEFGGKIRKSLNKELNKK